MAFTLDQIQNYQMIFGHRSKFKSNDKEPYMLKRAGLLFL